MKKFVAMMVMVIMMLAMATGMADTAVTKPEIHQYDQSIFWSQDWDLRMEFYAQLPEYGYVCMIITTSFNDNAYENYNHGTVKAFDANTGELIDETEGNIVDGIDCSSKDVDTVRENIMNYVENYDYEADAERGVIYYSIWF